MIRFIGRFHKFGAMVQRLARGPFNPSTASSTKGLTVKNQ
jgi:hypothetical protein